MNTLRALIFGAVAAAALTVTMNTVTAAEPQAVVRLDGVEVTAHRDASDTDGLEVVRLDTVYVTAHKSVD